MAATRKFSFSAGADASLEAQERELIDRLLASAAGLPRVCGLKRCRRRKRCLGSDLVCLRRHHGLARARLPSALKKLGWLNRRDDGSPL